MIWYKFNRHLYENFQLGYQKFQKLGKSYNFKWQIFNFVYVKRLEKFSTHTMSNVKHEKLWKFDQSIQLALEKIWINKPTKWKLACGLENFKKLYKWYKFTSQTWKVSTVTSKHSQSLAKHTTSNFKLSNFYVKRLEKLPTHTISTVKHMKNFEKLINRFSLD